MVCDVYSAMFILCMYTFHHNEKTRRRWLQYRRLREASIWNVLVVIADMYVSREGWK